jgi:hypothetical protein
MFARHVRTAAVETSCCSNLGVHRGKKLRIPTLATGPAGITAGRGRQPVVHRVRRQQDRGVHPAQARWVSVRVPRSWLRRAARPPNEEMAPTGQIRRQKVHNWRAARVRATFGILEAEPSNNRLACIRIRSRAETMASEKRCPACGEGILIDIAFTAGHRSPGEPSSCRIRQGNLRPLVVSQFEDPG